MLAPFPDARGQEIESFNDGGGAAKKGQAEEEGLYEAREREKWTLSVLFIPKKSRAGQAGL